MQKGDKGMKATEAAFSPATDGDGFPGTEGRIILTIALLGNLDLIALSFSKSAGYLLASGDLHCDYRL